MMMTPATESKAGYLTVIINWLVIQWAGWGHVLIDALATIVSALLACVLLYRNVTGLIKDRKDKTDKEKQN